ncbi:GNAT family N-acetyltransferase [Niveibacterium umoris]|uniref:GNAT superfamily N-acetyltransferase n=1 Tax=Niveibacterium umoris TaxID=1193620 RepID=A0A840BG72_9RHOO|nr:GNAT family N-acetyltransferase [Niveibacterium umoris]MBB4012541.1 GNAT superfamily N-acetyltransferase [Niveibacterium umoris]
MLHIRLMTPGDLDPVFDLQCRAHTPDYHESRAALASRFERGRQSCFVAELGHRAVAYLLAHPWAGPPPILHHALPKLVMPDHLFLHDLAVLPEARGAGAAAALISALEKHCRRAGFGEIRLVALVDAVSFWQRRGWKPLGGVTLDRSYGVGARLKTRAVGG